MLNGNTVLQPTTYDLLGKHRSRLLDNLNKVKVGIVESFDATKRTAKIELAFKRPQNDGSILPYPVLVDCPVFFLQGGGKGFSAPIASGDECIVLFSDQALDTWFEEGGSEPPASTRVHDLSDGIALVGLNSLANPSQYALATGEVGFSDGDAKVAANNGLVTVKNQTQSLLTILNLLTTYLTALNAALAAMTTSSISSGTTQAAIAALATQITAITSDFAELLYP